MNTRTNVETQRGLVFNTDVTVMTNLSLGCAVYFILLIREPQDM